MNSVRLSVGNPQDLSYLNTDTYPSYYFVKDELHRGRVEICDSGGGYKPLVVCDDSWNNQEASTVCKELGFSPHGTYVGTYPRVLQSYHSRIIIITVCTTMKNYGTSLLQ